MLLSSCVPRLSRTPSWLLAVLLAVLVGGSGCGGGKGAKNSVSGKVTFKGQTVAGFVFFIGADNKEVSAGIDSDGTYLVSNPPMGQVRVAVRGLPKGPPPPKDSSGMPGTQSPTGVAPPARYAAADNGLTFNVTGGKQEFNIELAP
jgi:hypothetical protein